MFQDAIFICSRASVRRAGTAHRAVATTRMQTVIVFGKLPKTAGWQPALPDHNSIFTPGVGTITSEPGNRADNCARIHSTAGGSPWTSRIFFGPTFAA